MFVKSVISFQHSKEKNKLESEWHSEKQDLLTRHEEELKSITTSQTKDGDQQQQKIQNEVFTCFIFLNTGHL